MGDAPRGVSTFRGSPVFRGGAAHGTFLLDESDPFSPSRRPRGLAARRGAGPRGPVRVRPLVAVRGRAASTSSTRTCAPASTTARCPRRWPAAREPESWTRWGSGVAEVLRRGPGGVPATRRASMPRQGGAARRADDPAARRASTVRDPAAALPLQGMTAHYLTHTICPLEAGRPVCSSTPRPAASGSSRHRWRSSLGARGLRHLLDRGEGRGRARRRRRPRHPLHPDEFRR